MTSHEPQASRPLALIADDHVDTRKMYALFLRAEGLAVEEACDGDEAFRQAAALRPDVIATDLYLPGATGPNMCQRLKTQDTTREIPVIVVTGWVLPGQVEEAMASGCVSVLLKPCLPTELLAEIRRVLALSETR